MAQQSLIARAGQGLLEVFMLLLRGIGALCAAFGAFVLFAWKHADYNDSHTGELTDVEKQMRDLDPGFEDGGFYRYKQH